MVQAFLVLHDEDPEAGVISLLLAKQGQDLFIRRFLHGITVR
jgi:hypothetical protein